MSGFMFREAVSEDVPELSGMEKECFPTDRIAPRQFRYLIRRGRGVFLVAIAPKGGVVAGYGVCLLPARRRVARLYSLAVLPEYRGQGLAEELLRRLLGAVKGQGFSVCSLEVRAGALKVQRLYERFGFSVWKYLQGYYEDGEDALRMRVNL